MYFRLALVVAIDGGVHCTSLKCKNKCHAWTKHTHINTSHTHTHTHWQTHIALTFRQLHPLQLPPCHPLGTLHLLHVVRFWAQVYITLGLLTAAAMWVCVCDSVCAWEGMCVCVPECTEQPAKHCWLNSFVLWFCSTLAQPNPLAATPPPQPLCSLLANI